MASVNENLRDADISHQVDLQHYANGIVRKMIALLNRTDSDLFAQLTVALEKMPPESFNVKRLEQLLTSVRDLNTQAYAALSDELHTELADLAEYESGYQAQLFRSVIPAQIVAQVDIATVAAEQVYAAAMARPFQGRLLKEWSSTIDENRMARIRDAVRIGYVENQSVSEIVKRVRGTKAKGYSDGIIEIDRRNAEAVVRTAINHTAAFTRNRFLQANNDLIKAVVWTSTLDSRTSEGCRLRDGLKYTPDEHKPIGHKVPWLAGPGALHWNCFPAGTLVTSSSPIRAVMKRWFDGDLIIINTAGGRLVSCTPNHPILTTRGWVAAEQIDRLDQVVCDGGSQWVACGDDDSDDMPARIEDVTEAFLASSGMVSMEVPVSAPYFHGDGAGSDVAVVGADRGLLVARETSSTKHLDQLGLVSGDSLTAVPVARFGAFGALLNASFAAGRRLVRRSREMLNLLRSRVSHACELLLRPIPRFNAGGFQVPQYDAGSGVEVLGDASDACTTAEQLKQLILRKRLQYGRDTIAVRSENPRDDFLRNSEALGDGGCAFAGFESSDNRLGIKAVDVPSHDHATKFEDGGDSGRTEAKLAADIIAGAAGVVFLDDVVSVSRCTFSGHVYNLETELGAYTANGIISHNCRSTSVPVTKSWGELGGVDIGEFNPETRASMDGQVPADTSYADWIKKQPAGRQDEILGATRGKLMRDGQLTLDRFYNERGKYLTLDELRKRDAAAFERVGL